MRLKLTTAPKKPRTIRSYRRVAQMEHGSCAQCNRPIKSGDEYDAHVQVLGDRLWVQKYHVYCPDDWFEEQEEIDRVAEVHHNKQEVSRREHRNAA